MNHSEIVSFLWGVADLIRDTFKRGKYQDVILPLTVLRRLDCVLAPTKDKVLRARRSCAARGFKISTGSSARPPASPSTTPRATTSTSSCADAPQLAANLRNYIAGFSQNMREVLEKLRLRQHDQQARRGRACSSRCSSASRTSTCIPDAVDNPTMGTIFEELIRKFNEALNENPGEHFTPRDVVHLMVDLHAGGRRGAHSPPGRGLHRLRSLLRLRRHADDHQGAHHDRAAPERRHPPVAINPEAEIHLFGQEVNPETWAVSKSDLFMKDPTGRDADNIAFGSTLSNDRHAGMHFDYLIANPPYGKDWKRDEEAVRGRARAGRRRPLRPPACRGSATASSSSCSTCWRTPRTRRKAAPASPSS